jgi:HSP20 family protein
MAEPQTTEIPIDKARGRSSGDSSAVKPEERSFAAADTALRVQHEAAGMAQDLSQTAAQATRAAGRRGREAAQDVADNWRDATDSLMAMQLDMNRWVDDFWRQATGFEAFSALRPSRPFAAFSAASLFGLPPVDLNEGEDAYRLSVELPGLTREEVDLEIRGDTLRVSGHKAEEKDDYGAAYRVSERRFGRFERRFPLPARVDRSKIEARFKDGVLNIVLPKTREAAGTGEKVAIKG